MRGSILGLALGAGLTLGAMPAAADCIGTFSFTGAIQTCTIDVAGTYLLDLYGAQGGGTQGGLGARAGGTVTLSVGDVLSILVGGAGGLTTGTGDVGNGGGDGSDFAWSGGGGGYSGGGSGTSGGGGGSFLAAAVTDDVLTAGIRSGNGLVTISLQAAVVETPEPASLTLLAGALGLLALRRRG